jgi:hypothetical protein
MKTAMWRSAYNATASDRKANFKSERLLTLALYSIKIEIFLFNM